MFGWNRFAKLLLPGCALLVLSTVTAWAQVAAPVSTVPGPSRVDLYGGYAYFHPYNSTINGYEYQPINPGAVASASAYFNRWLGVQVEGGFHPDGPNDCVYTAQGGPIARFQHGRFVPFVHALAGGAKVGGPVFQPCTWGWGVTGGGGFDWIVAKHLAIRPIQADYEHTHVDYGPLVLPAGVSGGSDGTIDAYRLSAGLVLRFGDMMPPPPVTLSCTVQPASGFPGDPLTVSAMATYLNPKKKADYTWTANAGNITGTTETATIDTTGVAPGSYTVTGHVAQGKKPNQQATCTAGYTVKAFEPPTISCVADPSTVKPGDSSTITSTGISPQNRPLTYSYTASAGTISGSGTTATLSTAGAPSGAITVTCNAQDDQGQTATATTTVNVVAPPPPAPKTSALCSISFERDKRRPARVDNEAKACLDDVALSLQKNTDATAVLVGEADPAEKNAGHLAAQRAVNTKDYLVTEKGIAADRISVRTGSTGQKKVENYLVPSGATFENDVPGTNSVDEGSVKAQTRTMRRTAHHRKAEQ